MKRLMSIIFATVVTWGFVYGFVRDVPRPRCPEGRVCVYREPVG